MVFGFSADKLTVWLFTILLSKAEKVEYTFACVPYATWELDGIFVDQEIMAPVPLDVLVAVMPDKAKAVVVEAVEVAVCVEVAVEVPVLVEVPMLVEVPVLVDVAVEEALFVDVETSVEVAT